MRLRMTLALGAALAAAGAARAQGSYGMAPVGEQKLPDPPALEIEQKLGAQVPTDLTFRDEHNNPVRLGDLIGGKPAVLVLAYYRCPQLCNQVLNGVVDAMRKIPLDVGADYTVITVSFDPKEKPPLAWEKKHNYVREYGRPGAEQGWHFLTGDKASIDALAGAVGFKYEYDPRKKLYYHASGIMVLTPGGKVSRYFFGIEYPAMDLRLGLVEASEGGVGSVADRLLLLCYHYDPVTGTYKSVMDILAVAGALTVLALGVVLFRVWRQARRDAARAAAGQQA